MKMWVTWSELTKTSRGTIEELRKLLGMYRPSSVLKACARLSVLFNFGPEGDTTASDQVTTFWIPVLFPKNIGQDVVKFAQTGRVIFFQAQLRFIAAELIRMSPTPSEDLPEIPNDHVGELLVRAGELLYQPHPKPIEPLDGIANLVVQFLPLYEIDSPTDPAILLLRFYIFLTINIPRLSPELRTFDVPQLFEKQFGFSLRAYCEFVFLFLMHGLIVREKKSVEVAINSGLGVSSFQHAAVSQDLIQQIFKAVSFSLDNMQDGKVPSGYADFEFLRDHPYFEHHQELFCLDYEYAVGKLESGALWRVLKALPRDKQLPYLSFWGHVFEDYVAWLFETYAPTRLNTFYSSPRYENASANQICDAIVVCGSTAVLIEAKLATCPAHVRYSGDYAKMKAFLEDRLVCGTDRKVGVAQLLQAIETLTSLPEAQLPKWLRGIKKFIPAIITKDDLGSSWMVNTYLNARFKEQVNRKKHRDYTVVPLVSMSVSTLERTVSAMRKIPFSAILENRIRSDKPLGRAFEGASDYAPRGTPRNVDAHMKAMRELCDDAIKDFNLTDPGMTEARFIGQSS